METGPDTESFVVAELGLDVAGGDDLVLGRAEVVPELCVPGTDTLRASVVLTWADVLAGAVAGLAMSPRIPLTLDLEVQLLRPSAPGAFLSACGSLVRAGRSVTVTDCWFRDEADGHPVAFAVATFVPAPDPTHVFPDGFPLPEGLAGRLPVPLAERLDCRLVQPGTVEMPRRSDGLNAVGAMQGGLASVAMEEAALSLLPAPGTLSSLAVRYLRPVMHGPALAVAEGADDLRTVGLTDTATGKLCLFATARIAAPPARRNI